jgi:exonuclease SbcC
VRPVRIEVKGFGAFREPTEIDLEGLELVALVGPTGSGKSTVIDAMTFALYGSIPRYDDDRLVAPAIHQLANEARVRLDFELDGTAYTAVRVVRRSAAGGGTTKEARLEREGEVVVSGARELTPAVQELLGLDFSQFTKTIVLPQGDFAEFLHDTPADRQKLLRQLLDLGVYAHMGQLARQRAARARERAGFLEEQLAKAGDVTEERLAELVAREGLLRERGADVERGVAEIAEVERLLKEERAAVEALSRQVAALANLEMPGDVAGLDERLAAARKALVGASERMEQARTARDAAKAAVAQGPDPARIERLLQAHEDRATVVEEVERLTQEDEAAEEQEAAAQRDEARARAVHDAAMEWSREVRLASDAAGWVSSLEVGQPCPVCRQTVAELPDHDVEAERAAAEKAEAAAEAARHAAAKVLRGAERHHVTVAANLAASIERLKTIDAQLLDAPTVDQLQADRERANELAAVLGVAEGRVASAENELAGARSELEARQADERTARRAFTKARDRLSELGPPMPDDERLLDDWQALLDWAAGEHRDRTGELQAGGARRDELEQRADALARELRELFDTLAIEGGPSLGPAQMVPALKEALGQARADVASVRAQLAQVEGWRKERAAAADAASVSSELGRLLRAEGFEQWLLAEALDELVERATDRLLELSGGQYSLVAEDNHFRIRDHRNADELRDARSLSGGETFVASLSLALALTERIADLAADGSARLESMFLDEGFGTLDPETLDVVASVLEELGATGRMVGIVTHIRDLADRMPSRLEVRKGPTTSTVERVER